MIQTKPILRHPSYINVILVWQDTYVYQVTVISNSSVDHHLYIDCTQLCLSFSASDFLCALVSHLNVYLCVDNICHEISQNFGHRFLVIGYSESQFLQHQNEPLNLTSSFRNMKKIMKYWNFYFTNFPLSNDKTAMGCFSDHQLPASVLFVFVQCLFRRQM